MATATRREPTALPTNVAKRLSLSDSSKGGTGLPPRIVLYGRPGVGKTSVAAQAEAPYFLLSGGETGLHSLIDSRQLPAEMPNIEVPDWESTIGILDDLTTMQHSRKTLVIDTANGLEKLANVFTRKRDYPGENGDKEFIAYQAGYRTCAMGAWKELLVSLDRLRREKRMLIILLAHTSVAKVANPSGGDFTKWAPAFDGRWAWESTYAWCDVCLFADFDLTVVKERQKDSKGKAVSAGRRFFRTAWSPDFDAKSRYPLPDEIEMGDSASEAWANLWVAMKPASNGKENA
jgi:hypothetical protein